MSRHRFYMKGERLALKISKLSKIASENSTVIQRATGCIARKSENMKNTTTKINLWTTSQSA